MSTLRNVDSIANPKNAGGEFQPSVQRSAPLEEGGHQPGRKVAPEDFAPEYHAQSFPPGTAPASNSFTPNTVNEPGSQALNPNVERAHGKESVKTNAGDTLMGATSKDVNTGFGQPISGQTKSEIYHDGQHGRKRAGYGLEGVGSFRQNHQLERDIPGQRGIDRDYAQPGQRGGKGALAAEERNPEGAERLAAE